MRFVIYLCGLMLATLSFSVNAQTTHHPEPLTRIVLGSCLNQEKPQPVWPVIQAQNPGLVILMGDNVYTDTKRLLDQYGKASTERFGVAYQGLADDPGFQNLRASTPIIATWDDHDYGLNDAGGEYADKAKAQQIFWDFWEEPKDSPRRQQAGVYAAYTYGPEGQRIQVLLLDTRYHRSALSFVNENNRKMYVPSSRRDQTILGDEQWRWLENQLQKPADLRLIVTSIQYLVDEHRFEKWANFPRERAKLAQLLMDNQVTGVILASGDRHHAEISRTDELPLGYPLFELTASGLNQGRPNITEVNRYRVGPVYGMPHFGQIDIDWEQDTITLAIVSAEGETVHAVETSLAALQAD